MIYCDGTAAICRIQCTTTVEDINELPKALSHVKPSMQDLEQLCVSYRTPLDIDSYQGIHFIGHKVPE